MGIMKVDVIIPVYKPDNTLIELVDRLLNQTVVPDSIILMNTGRELFQEFDRQTGLTSKIPGLKVVHLTKQEFDHGGTRQRAVEEQSKGDYFVMMTQDAVPVDDKLIESLIRHLQDPDSKVAVAYGRQLPRAGATIEESCTREFNYPARSIIKSAEDLKTLGIKTYFCSDVCAAYRRDIFDELGGFVRHTLFNEDMLYAAKAIGSGYRVAYEAEAKVLHSHDYGHMQQFHRNFDLAVSQAEHPEVFATVSSTSEGKKLVKTTISQMLKAGKGLRIPHFVVNCGFRYLGFYLGTRYKKLPRWIVRRCTTNPGYFFTTN